jgi:hypothetical protein
MPIRFRCVYCNQLLGISRRKAGTIVRCTSCEGQLIVPEPSDAPTEGGSDEPSVEPPADEPQKADGSSGPGGVFDAEEFDAFLEPLAPAGGPAVAISPAPPVRQLPAAPAEMTTGLALVPAMVLTRPGLTIAVAVAIVGLTLSFAGGVWLGMALR